MNNTNNNLISIVTQAYYGNRVGTEIPKNRVDEFILGIVEGDIHEAHKVDRTIVHLPNLDNIILVYNKYNEERVINGELWVSPNWEWVNWEWIEERKQENLKRERKPLAIIPELNMKIYSKCFVCRVDENGKLASLIDGDYEKFEKYLAE